MVEKLIIVADKDSPARAALCKVLRESEKLFHVDIIHPRNYWQTPNEIQGDSENGLHVNKQDVVAEDVTEEFYYNEFLRERRNAGR